MQNIHFFFQGTYFLEATLTTGFVIRYYQPNRDVFLHTNN